MYLNITSHCSSTFCVYHMHFLYIHTTIAATYIYIYIYTYCYISAGEHKDALPSDINTMKKKTYSLNKRLKLLVDRKDISILERDLPAKREFVLTLKMTGFQKHLYRYILYSMYVC